MTDAEFIDFMRSLPREQSQEEVDRHERRHDIERGEWVAHQQVHHGHGEARR